MLEKRLYQVVLSKIYNLDREHTGFSFVKSFLLPNKLIFSPNNYLSIKLHEMFYKPT